MKFSPFLYGLVTVTILLALLGTALMFMPLGEQQRERVKLSKQDRIDLAMAQEVEMTMDPQTGEVPRERLLTAYAYAERQAQSSSRAAINNVSWTERGPNNQGGRTRAIMYDPSDLTHKTVWAASVGGGLWKTQDITAAPPVWQQVDDFFANIAITALAYDPSNTQIRYFGTGEGYYNSDAARGLGIWKSTDAGGSWSQLGSTQNSNFHYCFRILVTDSGTVMAATRSGLRRSTDGGNTWTKVLGGSGISNTIYDLELASNGYIFASADGSLHSSTDDGMTFSAAIALPISADRIELATAPSDPSYLYALVENGNVVEGILQSTDRGSTWIVRNEPSDADPGIWPTDFSRNQAWYDLTIAVDPNNRDVLWVGGIDLFKSNNGGDSWTQTSHWWGGYGFPNVHADQHLIVYAPGSSSELLIGNDGGIYRSTNAAAASPSFTRKEQGFRTLQFYSCAMHPDSNSSHYLAGSQDNGTHKFSMGGLGSTVEATGGDGGFCHIDQDQPQYQFSSYVYNNFFGSSNGGGFFLSYSFGNTGRFINPSDYDNDANIMYSGAGTGSYLRWNDPQTGSSRTTISASFAGKVSAVTCDPNVNDQVFFGMGGGEVYRVTNADAAVPVVTLINSGSGMPSAYVSCIEIEKNNSNHLLVTFSNYGVNSVWESQDAGLNWTSIEGNLPDMPVRWAMFSPNDPSQVLLATELGIWSTDALNGNLTNWGSSNSGLAHVRVDMLQHRASDNQVIAASHGRGLFSTDAFMDASAAFDADRKIVYVGKNVTFQDLSTQAVSWSWDFGDGNGSTQQNPVHSYSNSGLYTISLAINGAAETDTQVAFIHVLPNLGNNYPATSGGNFESNLLHFGADNIVGTGFERGSSAVNGKQGTFSGSAAWVTGLTGNYVNNSEAYLYGPNFDLSTVGTYVFRFRSRFKTEVDYDGFRVEYSLNRGDTWTNLGAVQAFWYNFANATGGTPFPTGQAYFNGNLSGAFNEYYYDVSSLSGNSDVAFRFVFISDPFVTDAGVAIDDVELEPYVLDGAKPSIAAHWDDRHGLLSWQFDAEHFYQSFGVERAEWGGEFEEIGKVEGERDQWIYEFRDIQALQRNQYRIKMLDADGNQSYSSVVELSRPTAEASFKMYPNPVHTHLKLDLSEQTSLRLLDSHGRLVRQEKLPSGSHVWAMQELASGIYFLELSFGNGQLVSRKLLKK